MSLFKELRYQHYGIWVSSYFIMETYRSTYIEVVFLVSIPVEYKQLDEVMVLLPPFIDYRQVGRLQNHKCIPSWGECLIQKNAVVAKGSITQTKTVTLGFPQIQQKLNLQVGLSQVSKVRSSQRIDLMSKLLKTLIKNMLSLI